LDTDKQAQLDGGQAHLDDGGTKKKIENENRNYFFTNFENKRV
jgi:hypothetical protein